MLKQKSKQGISLITVLLFMLVATIAATGVYKWLSSENKASASRLMQSEVYQASAAGIETARSWMVHHAADVGAVIKQYQSNGRKPILLDSVLHPLASNKDQKFSVYLVGVDTKSYPYKVKLASTGYARGSSKYSQISILSVDGLYKVNVPSKASSVDFTYAYFGGSITYQGKTEISSVAINGNWDKNPPVTHGDFIVTGNADLSGNKVRVYGNTCIGGNAEFNNGFRGDGDLYVGGNASAFNGTVGKNAYFEGNLAFGSTSSEAFTVLGNMSLVGQMTTKQNDFKHSIMGNLCLENSGKIHFTGTNNDFELVGSSWIPTPNALSGNTSAANAQKVKLSTDPSASMNIAGAQYVSAGAGASTNYKQNNTHFNTRANTQNTSASGVAPFECGHSAKEYCDAIWSKEPGCDNSNYKIKDPLSTAYNTFRTYANNASCSQNIKKLGANNQADQTIDSLNNCYHSLKDNDPDKLYNGFLVLNMTHESNSHPKTKISGKVILIYENYVNGDFRIPPTTDDAVVVVYLKNGANNIMPPDGHNKFNYFIYSEADIEQLINFRENGAQISGSVYASAENCAKVKSANGNEGLFLDFNQDLMDELSSANIICANDGSTCGSAGGTETGSTVPGGSGALDAYYIPTSPRLRLALESQYVNKELDPDTLSASSFESVQASLLVLPRTIYLPLNAKSSLDQYFTVLNLNGATENPENGSISCTPSGLNSSGDLSGSSPNIYACQYLPSSNAYEAVPFYVVVAGESDNMAKISFTESSKEVEGGSISQVNLNVVGGAGSIVADVKVSMATGWTLTPLAGVTNLGGGVYSIEISVNGNATIPIFELQAGPSNSTTFVLVSPTVGAELTSPNLLNVYVNGASTVRRNGDLNSYLNENRSDLSAEAITYLEKVVQYPSCGDFTPDIWVNPVGSSCVSEIDNEQWTCNLSESSIRLGAASAVNLEACFFVDIPYNNSVEEPEDGGDYTLYASLKRKPLPLTIKTIAGSGDFSLIDAAENTLIDEMSLNANASNSFEVFYGEEYRVQVTAKGEHQFSYWKCVSASGTACEIPSLTGNTYTITPTSTDTLYAYFNQPSSCFTDDFDDLESTCPAPLGNCIDECNAGLGAGASCSVKEGKNGNSNWVMVARNNSGEFKRPEIKKDSDGDTYLLGNDKSAIVLKPTPAGFNGVYTAGVRLSSKTRVNPLHALNSGLVFRATENASSYYSLSILPNKTDNVLQLCYAISSFIENDSKCITGGSISNTSPHLDPVELYTLKAEIHNDSLVVAVFDRVGKRVIGPVTFNLLDTKFNANISATYNEYVGFKLYGDHFSIYSLSWDFDTYLCLDQAQLACSFHANYAGGWVPLNEPVQPWAYVSNACATGDDACCTYEFKPSYMSFTEEGPQPEDAVTVSAVCNGVSVGEVNCGPFNVGKRSQCVEDVFLDQEYSCYGAEECEIAFPKTLNLREASLGLNLNLQPGDAVDMYLLDENGNASQIVYLKGSDSLLSVNEFLDIQSFNPEKVRSLKYKSKNKNSVQISNFKVICPYMVQLSNCAVSYDGHSIHFAANVKNASRCVISGTGIEGKDFNSCNESFTYTEHVDLLPAYADQTGEWSIKAYGLDGSVQVDCKDTQTIKMPSGVCEWNPASLRTTQKASATFKVTFSDCPPMGCDYKIKNHSDSLVGQGLGSEGTASFKTPAPVGEYTYTAYIGSEEICSATLKVNDAIAPRITACYDPTSNGLFRARVSDPDSVGYNYQFAVTDDKGMPVDSTELKQGIGRKYLFWRFIPSVEGMYIYSIKLNGELACSNQYEVTGSIDTCSLSRPTITEGEAVTFNVTTNKIADGTPCEIEHSGGTRPTTHSTIDNNSCTGSFYPALSGAYSIKVAEKSMSCGNITVNPIPSSSSEVVLSSSSAEVPCEYEASWCNNMYATADLVPTTPPPPNSQMVDSENCFFVKDIIFGGGWSTNNYGDHLVNSVPKSPFNDLGGITKKDGGYYVYTSQYAQISSNMTYTLGSPSCLGGGSPPASSSSVTPSSSSTSGGGISVTLTYDVFVDFVAGNTYNVSYSASNGVFICNGGSGNSSTTVTFNGESKNEEQLWVNNSTWFSQWSIDKPYSNVPLLVEGGNVKCKMAW